MIVAIQTDPTTGELIVPLPEEILAQMELSIGDTIVWTVQEDGRVIITKKAIS